ncbi:MAG: hypothetical protein DME09_07095 [Candidatus Rokuibacteriota bacterium]|nr:MAG: hypothetical protein DME09_07095 [Candidatus Rokubacteria bacterium]
MEGALVGIVGDFDAGYETHHASGRALAQLGLRFQWVASSEVSAQRPEERLAGYAGLLIAPASHPYRSMAGVLAAIRFARERVVPLVGT